MLQRRQGRRSFLLTLATACGVEAQTQSSTNSSIGRVIPSAAVRYADPATEFIVVRLTDPQFSSHLPDSGNHVTTNRGLLYGNDGTGSWQAFWLDWKSRSSRQLTEVNALDPESLALQSNERGFWYADGASLFSAPLSGIRKTREIYRRPKGATKTSGITFNDSGTHAVFVETSSAANARYALRVLDIASGSAKTLIESGDPIEDLRFRPRHNSFLYRHAGMFSTIDLDGRQNRPLPLAMGETVEAEWKADGSSLFYLSRPPDPKKLTGLHEWIPESGGDTLIADTSQFVRFAANGDSSVFIGASGSKASPYILLLIRSGKRELTLAEHRASDARMTAPQFGPNSQFICFTSDRHGKPAIYWIPVEKLVSETDGS